MRRLTVFLVAVLILSLAAPALADTSSLTDAPVRGDRIDIRTGTPEVYPAGEAFHIFHAWFFDFTAIDEMRGNIEDPGLTIEVDVDGASVRLRPWFNVWDVDATCDSPRKEAILERITRAERFLRLADRWDCEATGIWVKGYFRNYPMGMTGTHDFEVRFLEPGFVTEPFTHTVEFTP